MPTPRRLIGPLVICMLILFGIPVTSAASPQQTSTASSASDDTTETVRETVAWTLPADQCGSIPKGLSVSGAGQRVMHTRTWVDNEDTTRVRVEDTVKGPAIDSKGREYRFTYYNLSTRVIPESGKPINVHMVDVFELRRDKKPANSTAFTGFRVDFDWTWTYSPPAEVWPPQSNLVKYDTHGDPYNCDPI